jgi:hypothetical protein
MSCGKRRSPLSNTFDMIFYTPTAFWTQLNMIEMVKEILQIHFGGKKILLSHTLSVVTPPKEPVYSGRAKKLALDGHIFLMNKKIKLI